MNKIVAVVWVVASLVIARLAVQTAMGPKGDSSAWFVVLGFAVAALYGAWRAVREWKTPTVPRQPVGRPDPAVEAAIAAARAPSGAATPDFPGAWRGSPVALETQIETLELAGLKLAPGRTIDELLDSWPRREYESDPWNLILLMYGCEVEAEPWGRFYCERAWNFDMECLENEGDYVRAFRQILRIAGATDQVTALSDDFDINKADCTIRYTIRGRQASIQAIVNSDWADPEAVITFVRDVEATVGDGRRFWAADNGQASILLFVTDAEAARVNAFRPGVLERYA